MKVLVTRPTGQQLGLQQELADAGVDSLHLPLLEITPVEVAEEDKQFILNLDYFSGVIVVSPNAAKYGLSLIEQYWPQFPAQQHWVTNGQATKDILYQYGINAVIPENGTSTEDLIGLEQLKNIQGQKWLIIRGVGGRELLSKTLTQRGADISRLEIYRRSCPEFTHSEVVEKLNAVQAILVSSAEALDNLVKIASKQVIKQKILVVSSPRLLHIAQQLQCKKIVLAEGAGNSQMTRAITTLI